MPGRSGGANVRIIACSDIPQLTADDLAPVFWATSAGPDGVPSAMAREASSSTAHARFRAFWLDRYVQAMPQAAFVAVTTGGDRDPPHYVGYVVGAHDDGQIPAMLSDPVHRLVAEPVEFAAFQQAYPAHLHINVLSHMQGAGVGRSLIEAFCKRAQACGAAGVRVVTGAEATNIGFYEALGFEPLANANDALGRRVALLGRALSRRHA